MESIASVEETRSWTRALLGAGLLPDENEVSFLEVPRNLDRKDSGQRRRFLVLQGVDRVLHLTTSPDAEDLYAKHELFAASYPDLASGPLTLLRTDKGPVLVRPFHSGQPLLKWALQSGKTQTGIFKIILDLAARFETGKSESTPARRNDEFDHLRERILSHSHLGTLDRVILEEAVFPALERELSVRPAYSRVVHGDLIASNIIILENETPILVDLEFARTTHFFGHEWLRFLEFSGFSPDLRQALAVQLPEIPSWQQVVFWLEQIALENEINQPLVAAQLLPERLQKVYEIVRRDPLRYGRSVYFQQSSSEDENSREAEFHSDVFAQVYWANEGDHFSETRSIVSTLPNRERFFQKLTFDLPISEKCSLVHIRLDPINRPGIATLLSAEILAQSETGDEYLPGISFPECKPLGTTLALPQENPGALLSFGDECQVLLPAVRVPPSTQTLRMQLFIKYDLSYGSLLTKLTLYQDICRSALGNDQKETPKDETETEAFPGEGENEIRHVELFQAVCNDFRKRVDADLIAGSLSSDPDELAEYLVVLAGRLESIVSRKWKDIAPLLGPQAPQCRQNVPLLIEEMAEVIDRQTTAFNLLREENARLLSTLAEVIQHSTSDAAPHSSDASSPEELTDVKMQASAPQQSEPPVQKRNFSTILRKFWSSH